MRTTIYLCRHGDVHNPDRIFYGRIPGFYLSELGRKQAQKLGRHLKKKKLSAIYASPLERAQETASYIHHHHPQVALVTEARIIEVGSTKQGESMDLLAIDRWDFYKPEYVAQGSESLEAVWARMREFIEVIKTKHKGEEIAVVSHGDPIMISWMILEGKPLTLDTIRGAYYIPTAHAVEIVFEGKTVRTSLIEPM